MAQNHECQFLVAADTSLQNLTDRTQPGLDNSSLSQHGEAVCESARKNGFNESRMLKNVLKLTSTRHEYMHIGPSNELVDQLSREFFDEIGIDIPFLLLKTKKLQIVSLVHVDYPLALSQLS
jgi:hypothetical protein